jgi:hypothetical protein
LSDPSLINRPDQSIHHSHPPPQEIKIQQSQAAKNHHAFDEAMAKYLNGPVILEVANLADGTSAEDVKVDFFFFQKKNLQLKKLTQNSSPPSLSMSLDGFCRLRRDSRMFY